MIDEEKTLEQFGYTSDSLSHGSNKKIVAVCNKCGKERILYFQAYRDLCWLCSNNGMKGKKHSKESKLKMSISRIGKIPWNKGKTNIYSEETKERISNSLKEKYKDTIHPNWRGGSIKYCLKFDNECRENNRNKFYNKCFLCGKTEIENGRKLSVHHVDYNKNQGCNSDWKLIPVCMKCHSKTSGRYLRDYYEELISRLLYIRELIFEYENKIDYKSM